MTHAIYVLLIPLGALCWFFGGYGFGDDGIPNEHIPVIGKGWRRYVYPILAAGTVVVWHWGKGIEVCGVEAIAVAVSTGIVNSLGYGEGKTWMRRCLVGFLLGIPATVIDPSMAWPVVTGITFSSLYVFSRTHNWMMWGVVEAIVGATQSATIVMALMRTS